MQDLADLFRYNAWANARVFDIAAGLDAHTVDLEASGTRDTVANTLKHLAQVENVYLAMLERRPFEWRDGQAEYLAHDLGWFGSHLQELGASFVKLVEAADPDQLGRDLNIPWFDFAVTGREGLLQVLSHSAQHRSQVLSWLSGRGVQTPDLDYVVMLSEIRPRTSAPPRG
jgi:uncharacterized damage-inducible protein DinB